MSIDLTRFHASFFSESADHLEMAEQSLFHIERGRSNAENINELFRSIHSIKGSAGTLGFESIGNFAHEFEFLLEQLRSTKIVANEELIGLCFASLDLLSAMLSNAREGLPDVDRSRIEAVTRRLKLMANSPIEIEKSTTNHVPSNNVRPTPLLGDKKTNSFLIQFAPNSDFCKSGNDPILYLRELHQKGRCTVRLDMTELPSLSELDPSEAYLSWHIELHTELSIDEVKVIFDWVQDLCRLEVSQLQVPLTLTNIAHPIDTLSIGKPETLSERRRTTVHVRADRLDSLINQIGEIAISHSIFKQALKPLSAGLLFDTELARLDRQLRELQDTVLGLRMLPVRVLFGRFERLVRDASSQLHKELQLVIEGADTELDKNLIEKLADPITHLVKNAIDHGLDSEQDRAVAGKPPVGKVTLSARHEGGAVIITVADDGRGIDPKNIRLKAISLGLASELEPINSRDWLQFVYTPGFSTAASVNQWSGRGVGLDAVRKAIIDLRGELTMVSHLGKGTEFQIRLPLTLAIVDALIVRSGGIAYAIPMHFIAECLHELAFEMVKIAPGVTLPRLRGEFLRGVDLASYLKSTQTQEVDELKDHGVKVILQSGARRIMLGVDEIIAQEQIVVRSLQKNFKNPRYASGATILGDGKVVLILDPSTMLEDIVRNENKLEIAHAK